MMNVQSQAFATLLVLTLLMPLSLLVFHFWHTASIHYELTIQRQQCYEEVEQLEAVLTEFINQLKRDHIVIWANLDRLTQSLIVPFMLKQQSRAGEQQTHFRAVIDKPQHIDEQQLRICVQMLAPRERVKRSITCLLSRQQIKAEKEGYDFVVDYFTLDKLS